MTRASGRAGFVLAQVLLLPAVLQVPCHAEAEGPGPVDTGVPAMQAVTSSFPELNLSEILKYTGDLEVDLPAEIPLQVTSDVLLENILAEAQSQLSSNRYYHAAHSYWQALRLAPDHEQAIAGLSACFLLAKDYARAREAYRQLTTLYPSNQHYRLNLAAAYTGLNRPAAAVEELKRLLRLNPRHAEALYSLGMNLVLLQQPDKAGTAFAACRKFQPSNPLPLVAMARLAGARNDLSEMLRLLRLAVPHATPREMRLWLEDPAFDRWRDNDWFVAFLASLENQAR